MSRSGGLIIQIDKSGRDTGNRSLLLGCLLDLVDGIHNDLREKGYQLKAIRMYLKKEKRNEEKEQEARKNHVDIDGFVTLTSSKDLGLGEDMDAEPVADAASDPIHPVSRREDSQVSAEAQQQARIKNKEDKDHG